MVRNEFSYVISRKYIKSYGIIINGSVKEEKTLDRKLNTTYMRVKVDGVLQYTMGTRNTI